MYYIYMQVGMFLTVNVNGDYNLDIFDYIMKIT